MKYNWLLLFVIILTSCDLEEAPESTATKAAVFGSEMGLETYSNSFYSVLPTANSIHQGDAMADYAARTQVPDFLREGAFSSRQSSGWDWTSLRNINFFIENCKTASVPDDAKRHYLGLARFFRAWFYFDKVKRFGDVPWYNKAMTISDPDLHKGRDSRVLVMDSVLNDLKYACENIRTTDDKTRSLITKYVAWAFRSRVGLFEGTFRKYHTNLNLSGTANEWLTDAAESAKVVMDAGVFTLNEAGGTDMAYRQLFTSKAPVSNEIILAAVMDASQSVYNDANWWWTSATYGARVSLTRTFINTYLNIDGTPFTDVPGHESMTFAEEVKRRDKRLQQTIRIGDYKRINGGTPEPAPPVFSYTYTGYQPIKWTLDDTYYDGGTRNDNSISILRYAEVLLNYAEAKAELGTLTDEEWNKTIGDLRKRAGITGGLTNKPVAVDPYLQSTYFPHISDPALLEIRRERGIELVLEGLRFYDLVRWKRGDLMELKWKGFYVPSIDQPLDLNEDGVLDVYFYKGSMPASPVKGVTYINVSENINGIINPQRLSQDTYGEITWLSNVSVNWEDKHYFYPIPETDRLMNPNLEQNSGWE